MQQHLNLLGGDAGDCRLLVDEALFEHIDGDLHRRARGALPVTGLEHVKLAALYGELDILHVLVGGLEVGCDFEKLFVDLGHLDFQLRNGKRGADACDHVLALCVDEEFAVQLLRAVGGVACEAHAGAAVVAEVSVDHGDDVDGGAEAVGDVMKLPVGHRAGVAPALEDGEDGVLQLIPGVGREGESGLLLEDLFELGDNGFEILCGNFIVEREAEPLFRMRQDFFERLAVDAVHHVAVHLDKTAVAVERETAVGGGFRKRFDGLVVQAEIEDGVHHAGHGDGRAGTDRDKKRIASCAECFSGLFLKRFHRRNNVVPYSIEKCRILAVFEACVRRQNKARRNREPVRHHLGEVGPFAPEERLHVRVAFFETVDVLLFRHLYTAPP